MHPKELPVEPLNAKLSSYRDRLIMPRETVLLQLPGSVGDALICTNERVLILKIGSFNRESVYHLDYANVAGVQVVAGMLIGYVEISAAGMQIRPKNGAAEVRESPNCLSIVSKEAPKFQQASAFITAKLKTEQLDKSEKIEVSSATILPASQEVILATLARLGELREAGVLTEAEFTAKKTEMLSRL